MKCDAVSVMVFTGRGGRELVMCVEFTFMCYAGWGEARKY